MASGHKLGLGGAFCQTKVLTKDTFPFPGPLTHTYTNIDKSSRLMPYVSLHQPGSHCLSHPGDSLRPHPTKITGPLKLFIVTFPYKWPVLAHASDFPKISQTSSIWPQCAPYLLLSGPSPSTSSNWHSSHWGPSKPSTSNSHLQIA